MFPLSILAFSLFFIVRAASLPKRVDSNIDVPLMPVRSAKRASDAVLGPVAQLRIGNDYVAPDGYNRSATLANGILPGPLIRANKGDDFAIQVLNELTDDTMALETSIHFHGIFQQKSNWADGVAYVTQCPLRQQEAFVQKFNANGQTGTYWYHSHYSTQYCDGLRGPLVIYDPDDPLADLYDVDDENTIIALSDWYHKTGTELGRLFTKVIANSTLINGKGRYAGGPSAPLSVVNVTPGLRCRFRVIGMSCDLAFNFTIDGHRMTIIEVDGVETVPVEVDSIPVLAGQRYSVVVTADQAPGNYWIRALNDLPNATFDGGQNLAILRYEGAPEADPTSDPGPYELSFDECNLHPLINTGVPGIPEVGKADVNLVLALGNTSNGDLFTFNDVTFTNPPIPVLLQILSGARQASDLLPSGTVYTLPPNKVIEISFPNPLRSVGSPHPLHLHGHNFHVIRSAGSNETNFVDPVLRDVVSSGKSTTDNVIIRFVTDNPGPWFLHCHIDWHLNRGLAAVMAEADDEAAVQETEVIPADWEKLCLEDEDWGQTRSRRK